MIVTEISEALKTKVKVHLDNGQVFALYKSELRTYRIEEGRELPEKYYYKITGEVLPKRAKLRCMNLLKSRDYTEYQLRSKLRQGFYTDEIIDQAIAYVKSFGYVDDFRYAKTYTECAGNTKSRKQIEAALLRKGVSKEVIEQAYRACFEDGDVADEEKLIESLLVKKHFNRQEATAKECRKMAAFLYRRGFSADKIYKAVGCCCSR